MGVVAVYGIIVIHRINVTALEQNLARQVATEIRTELSEVAAAELEVTLASAQFIPLEPRQQKNILTQVISANTSFLELAFVCTTPRSCESGRETMRLIRNGVTDPVESDDLRLRAESEAFTVAARGDVYFGPARIEDGRTRMTIARPALNQNNEVIAVLIGDLRLNRLQGIVASAKLGTTGYVYVVDENGLIIAHPDQSKLGVNVGRSPAAQMVLTLMTKALDERRNVVYTNLNGQTVSGAGAFIPDFHWAVIAEWPQAETQNPIANIILQVLVFALIALILIMAMASRMAYKLISPIAYLSQGTNIIGSGNFKYRVDLKTGDELENLARNLNKMAENLEGLEELHELKLKTQYLSESLKKEHELSQVKDQFITTVSHQFNTPLSVINWTLAALKEQNVPPEVVRDGIKKIDQSRQEILAIVNDLLTLSEIGFSYKKGNTKLVDLRQLVAGAVSTLQNTVAAKHLTIKFIDHIPNTKAEANEFAIGKAIENLLDNAVTYSHDKGVITIELFGDADRIGIRVGDQGIGIPKDDLPKIFDQFFRARNAVEKKNVGTGLGLFIVKIIVEGHGGNVALTSEVGKGSTFSFTIPR
jgi:signal transduction histidine kinase